MGAGPDPEQDAPRSAASAGQEPLDLIRARRSAIAALSAYRAATDPAGLVAVFQALADDVPAHWLVTGLLSLSSQLVEYLAVSEQIEAADVLRALATLEAAGDEPFEDDPLDEGEDQTGNAG